MASSNPPRSAFDVPIADLSHLYDAPDPRRYYAALQALDYQTPRHVQNLVRWCLDQRQDEKSKQQTWTLDIGCGFATNAAGLRHGIDPMDLFARYDSPELSAMAPDELRAADSSYFASTEPLPDKIAGLEIAKNALDYGLETGLLDAGFSEDLTRNDPSDALRAVIDQTTLIMESGVPVFIFPYVIDAILSARTQSQRPWIVTAPPRFAELDIYREVLARHGYALEQASPDPLPHRKFVSEDEKRRITADQTTKGLDNTQEDETGYIHVNLFLARPEPEATTEIALVSQA